MSNRTLSHLTEPLAWGIGLALLITPAMFLGEGQTTRCVPEEFLCARVQTWDWEFHSYDYWRFWPAALLVASSLLVFWVADILQRGRTPRSRIAMIVPLIALIAFGAYHLIQPMNLFVDVANSDPVAVRISGSPIALVFGAMAAAAASLATYVLALMLSLVRRLRERAADPAPAAPG